ncbi:hypothetical protein CLOP_g11186, partial [Closterium sp. NIES-67]
LSPVRVLFSRSLDANTTSELTRIVERLGGDVVSDTSPATITTASALASSSSSSSPVVAAAAPAASICTHFVSATKITRTINLLVAISRGCHVCTPDWLHACARARGFVDAEGYGVRDRGKEREVGFKLQEAVGRARERGVLEGQRVFVTPSTTPDAHSLAAVAAAAGAEVLPSTSAQAAPTVIISCEADRAVCEARALQGVPIFSPEFLLTAAMRQQLDWDRNRLP